MSKLWRRVGTAALGAGILLSLGFGGCEHASAKDACPDLEKQGAIQTPYSIPELTDMITVLEDSSNTDNDSLNKSVAQALSDAQKLKKIEQGGPGDANGVENDLNSKLQDISNDCSTIVGGQGGG